VQVDHRLQQLLFFRWGKELSKVKRLGGTYRLRLGAMDHLGGVDMLSEHVVDLRYEILVVYQSSAC
jgi:hypothetical protein